MLILAQLTSVPQARKLLFATSQLTVLSIKVVPDSLYDLSDNRCNKDVLLPYKLWLFKFRHDVRQYPCFFLDNTDCVDNRSSGNETPRERAPSVRDEGPHWARLAQLDGCPCVQNATILPRQG